MSLRKLNQPLDRRTLAKVVGALLLVGLLVAGSWELWRRYQARPLDTAGVRQAIRKYLRSQTGDKRFEPLAVETADAGKTPIPAGDVAETGNSKKERRADKQRKAPQSDLSRVFQQRVQEAGNYKTIYRAIGQNLARVDQVIDSRDPVEVETALALAADACRAAHESALNEWLAARIAEGYLWAGLPFAATNENRHLTPEFLINAADEAFRQAGETNNLLQSFRLGIVYASTSGRADNMRMRLARELDDQGDPVTALSVMREVKETNGNVFQKRLAVLERRLRDKPVAR